MQFSFQKLKQYAFQFLIFDRLFHILKKKVPTNPINIFALVIGAETTCFKFQASYDRLQATSRNDTQRDDTHHIDTKNMTFSTTTLSITTLNIE